MATVRNDNITVNDENHTEDMLSGNDRVSVLASGAHIFGGTGNDRLTADIERIVEDEDDPDALSVDFHGDEGRDRLRAELNLENRWGISGNADATLAGGAGDDLVSLDLTTSLANASGTLSGGSGNDLIKVFAQILNGIPADGLRLDLSVSGDAGDDIIDVYGGANGEVNVSGGDGADQIRSEMRTSGAANIVSGGDGADEITALVWGGSEEGASLSNEISGGDGNDTIDAQMRIGGELPKGLNFVEGGSGGDTITAQVTVMEDTYSPEGHSELYGGQGNDHLTVSGGDGNILEGNQGKDTLFGGSGADQLIGGQDDDVLRGNGGADEFVFGAARNGERDRIADFRIGTDVMDISGIDANVFRAGNQSFTFSGPDDWHGTGRVWVENEAGTSRSIVYADNGRAVLEIALSDGRDVDAEDYSAGDFLL